MNRFNRTLYLLSLFIFHLFNYKIPSCGVIYDTVFIFRITHSLDIYSDVYVMYVTRVAYDLMRSIPFSSNK